MKEKPTGPELAVYERVLLFGRHDGIQPLPKPKALSNGFRYFSLGHRHTPLHTNSDTLGVSVKVVRRHWLLAVVSDCVIRNGFGARGCGS